MDPKRPKRSVADRQEQGDNNREIGAVGAYDVVSTHQGTPGVEKLVITTIHDILLQPLDLGKYYVLPLLHTREYVVEAYDEKKKPLRADY